MKLKLFIIIILSLFISSSIYSQSSLKDSLKYEIIYKYTYQKNKTDTTNIKSEEMILKIAENFSYYISHNNMKRREISYTSKNTNTIPLNIRSIPRPKIKYTILKNYQKNEIIFSDRFGTDFFSYTKKIDSFKWVLHNNQKVILGYSCKKATTSFAGRDYIAWYSIDIPIADGPYKFNGLPGLIFSIYDTEKHYSFNISSIKNIKKKFDTKEPIYKNIPITYNEFITLEKKYKEKPSSIINSGRITFPKELLDKADKRAKERLKYENNPIELKEGN